MSARGRGVIVVGGGLAGITAALDCVDAGCAVTLLEARPALGGLTSSFRRGELDVDNGQHVFLRCCTAYRGLLRRLGSEDRVALQPRLAIPVRAPGRAGPAWLRRTPLLPAPLHLAGALLRYPLLRPVERLRLVAAALALRGVDPADPATDDRSFGDWLAGHGQSPRAIRALWDLVGVATLNATAADASLALAATVFQLGLLTEAPAADLGWPLVPLRALHGEPAMAQLRQAGAVTQTGRKVDALVPFGPGWIVRAGGEEFVADQVILAVPPEAAERLLPATSRPGRSPELGSAPIVNVHVVYDRKVMDGDFFAAVDSPVQWVFDRTGPAGLATGQYLALSLSAADAYVDLPVAALRDRFLPALAALLPAAADATVRDFFVTRERQATFRPAPGAARLRPPPATEHPGLWLAGAWTATGWPATMEGAVRSGHAAAAGALGRRGAPLAHRDQPAGVDR